MATVAVTPDHDTITQRSSSPRPPYESCRRSPIPTRCRAGGDSRACIASRSGRPTFRRGGKWSSVGVGADGTSFRVDGEYLEVDPPRLLVHTWIASYGDPAKTVVRWELESRDVHGLHQSGPRRMGTGTLVRLQHQGFAGNVQSALGHGEGWRRILGWMAAFVENEDTVDTRPAVPPATGTKG